MSLLVVGSMAFDSIRSPFGEVDRVVGGSAGYSSLAAGYLVPGRLVSVVGTDFPGEVIRMLASRSIDLTGLKVSEGKTFHWKGFYEYDLNTAHTVTTELNVFRDFAPVLPEEYRDTPYVFLGNIAPALQLELLRRAPPPPLSSLAALTLMYRTHH